MFLDFTIDFHVMKADVVLRGYSGYNTRWALKVINKVFPANDGGGDPLAVTVFFGANDAALPDRYGAFQNVPLDEYKTNLHAIVAFFKVLLTSTTFHHTKQKKNKTKRGL